MSKFTLHKLYYYDIEKYLSFLKTDVTVTHYEKVIFAPCDFYIKSQITHKSQFAHYFSTETANI